MFEYKVAAYMVKEAENEMNLMAQKGWRVIAVTPNIFRGAGIVVTYEREINQI